MLNLFRKKTIQLFAPGNGKILSLDEIPDPAFAEKMVGDGIGFLPTDGKILSPCHGTIAHIFPTNHAVLIESAEGLEILLHLGIDTVDLKGEGFTPFIKTGAKVRPGTHLVTMDLSYIQSNDKSILCPMVITNMDQVKNMDYYYQDHASPTDLVLEVNLSK